MRGRVTSVNGGQYYGGGNYGGGGCYMCGGGGQNYGGQRYFGLHTAQGTYRIYPTRRTDWDGCDWQWMQAGRFVVVHAYHQNGHWVATSIARWRHHHMYGMR